MNKSVEYRLRAIHRSIMNRCYCLSCSSYRFYGGRGIGVDIRWHDISQFVRDMLPSYKSGLQIDRIDNNLGYSIANCRWVTRKQNCRNTRRTVFMTVGGVRRSLREWAEISGLKYGTVFYRFTHGKSPSECICPTLNFFERVTAANKSWVIRRAKYGKSGMKRIA